MELYSDYVRDTTNAGALHYTQRGAIIITPERPYRQNGWDRGDENWVLRVPSTLALPAGNEWFRDIPMPDLSGLSDDETERGRIFTQPDGSHVIVTYPRAGRILNLWEVLPCEHGVYGATCDDCGMAIGPATPEEIAIMDRYQTPRASALASNANAPTR